MSFCYYGTWKTRGSTYYDQINTRGFALLTAVYHEGMSVMAVGHNPSTSAHWPWQLEVHMECCRPHFWGSRAMSLEALVISPVPGFQIASPCIIR